MKKLVFAAVTVLAAVFAVSSACAACDTINSKKIKLSACVDDSDWIIQAPQGDQEFFYISPDERVAFSIIAEPQTVAASDYRAAIVANAKAGNNGKDATLLSERIENVADKPWNVIEYQFGDSGQEFTFQNFYYSQPGFGSVQVVFWSSPADATTAAYRAGKLVSTLSYGN